MRRLLLPFSLVLGLFCMAGLSMASQVYHHPGPAEKLEARWEWAVESAKKRDLAMVFGWPTASGISWVKTPFLPRPADTRTALLIIRSI